jgi:hypothetical protein
MDLKEIDLEDVRWIQVNDECRLSFVVVVLNLCIALKWGSS